MAKTHTWQRTAKHYRELGYRVIKTEHTSRGARHDLMGFVDGIAFGIGHTVYLQACGTDWQEHIRKITGPCLRNARCVLMAGNEIHLVGWRKLGKPAKWTPRIHSFTMDELKFIP